MRAWLQASALQKRQMAAYVLPHKRREALLHEDDFTNSPLTRVWGVVSNLVQALSDARDELLTLISCDSIRVGRKAGAARSRSSRSPSRPFSAPPESRRSPNRRDGLPMSSINSQRNHQKALAPSRARDSPPVNFGMDLEFENVHRGRSPPAGDHRKSTGWYQSITNQRRPGLEHFSPLPAGRGDRRRHCAATRYAELLKEETYHLRERRLAEESVPTIPNRPSWY